MEILDRQPRLGRNVSEIQAPGLPKDQWWEVVKALVASFGYSWWSTNPNLSFVRNSDRLWSHKGFLHTSTSFSDPCRVIFSISLHLSPLVLSHDWKNFLDYPEMHGIQYDLNLMCWAWLIGMNDGAVSWIMLISNLTFGISLSKQQQ